MLEINCLTVGMFGKNLIYYDKLSCWRRISLTDSFYLADALLPKFSMYITLTLFFTDIQGKRKILGKGIASEVPALVKLLFFDGAHMLFLRTNAFLCNCCLMVAFKTFLWNITWPRLTFDISVACCPLFSEQEVSFWMGMHLQGGLFLKFSLLRGGGSQF